MRGYHIRVRTTDRTGENLNLFGPLPNEKPKPTARRSAFVNYKGKDYRFGPIRIDWVDFSAEKKMASNTAAGDVKDKAKAHGKGFSVAVFIPSTATTASTNLAEGTVHVYRDADHAPDLKVEAAPHSDSDDGLTLGVLAVPSWMTPPDFLAFVAPAAETMAHLRIIRDSVPNRSLVIIKFTTVAAASEFAEAYNGKPFNSMDPEICRVVRVSSAIVDTDDSTLSRHEGSMYEIPTCPVCLERMDSAVTGLVTVPCSHTFHCMCLSKWGDSRCPVCRYSQSLLSPQPSSSSARPTSNPSAPILSSCGACGSMANLWICLICGNIGCGRYGRAHAQEHYKSTSHFYALELETQRVWDYAGDGYVHRLIRSRADGKLVELPSAASSMGATDREAGLGPGPADTMNAEKIEAIGLEYSYLLTSQLDSQRLFYEEQKIELKAQVDALRDHADRVSRELEKERASFSEAEKRRKEEEEARYKSLADDKIRAETRAKTVADLARKLDKELQEERAVGEGLMQNLTQVKEELENTAKEKAEREAKIADLEDQVRDVMFFLEAKTKIEQEDGPESEAAGGSVSVPIPAPKPQAKKKKARKKM